MRDAVDFSGCGAHKARKPAAQYGTNRSCTLSRSLERQVASDSLSMRPVSAMVSVSAPHYLGLGVDANALHRVVAIASGGLDSLPYNGYVVTTIRGVYRETYKAAYWPVFCMTVAVPMFGLIVALLLL